MKISSNFFEKSQTPCLPGLVAVLFSILSLSSGAVNASSEIKDIEVFRCEPYVGSNGVPKSNITAPAIVKIQGEGDQLYVRGSSVKSSLVVAGAKNFERLELVASQLETSQYESANYKVMFFFLKGRQRAQIVYKVIPLTANCVAQK